MFEIWVRRLIFVTKFSFKTAWFWESFGRGNFFPCPEFVGFNVRFVRFLRVCCAFGRNAEKAAKKGNSHEFSGPCRTVFRCVVWEFFLLSPN